MYRKRLLAALSVGSLLLVGCSSGIREPPLVGQITNNQVLEVQVLASTDDAEESASGGVTRSSTTLELIRSASNQTVGLRFTGLTIPSGATIINAYLQFRAKASTSEATSLAIQAQAADNPLSFSGTSYNVSSRARTTASVAWSPAAWTLGTAGSAQRTPDLAPVLQEVVNRPGWTSGNALALIVTGTGKRVASAFDEGSANAPLLHVEYSTVDTPPVPTVEARISTGTDDAEESASGGVTRSSTTLELVRSTSDQTVGLRFSGLEIPRGVAITNAYLQFKASKTTSEVTSLTVQGQAADDAVSFSGSSYNISSRTRTTASVAWSPAAWTSGVAGSAQRTPDLAPVIQEIVGRPGWVSGNALALIVTGTGQRVARSYEGSPADAPLLHIEYSATDTPPNINRFAAEPGSVVKGQPISLSWSVSDPDGDPLSCTLDVNGDGVADHTISNCRTTTSQTHTYTTAGRYWPTLSVTDPDDASDTATASLHITNSTTVTVAAAGDIACDPLDPDFNGGAGTATNCRMKATSDLLLAMKPDAVLTTGDNQYNDGMIEKFMQSYDPTWGRLKGITYPALGTHEYESGSAAGYFSYFGAAAGNPSRGYYSFDLGAWHIVVLNTSCSRVGGCGSGSPQERWLRADLAANPKACTLAVMKLPLFSSGEKRANTGQSEPLWRAAYEAGAELVLSGSDHLYERFAPQTPDGALDTARGVRQFVVGTGGKSLHSFFTVQSNSQARVSGTYGVLKLTLNASSYSWTFVPEAGKTATDSGTSTCH